MASIGIAFTDSGSVSYNVVITNFTGEDFPRQYMPSAGFSNSVSGAQVLDGPPFEQKYFWTIAAIIPAADALSLDALFNAWDADRASGLAVACGLTDETFGATLNKNVVFSTPPTYTYKGPAQTLVSFGLTEV